MKNVSKKGYDKRANKNIARSNGFNKVKKNPNHRKKFCIDTYFESQEEE